MSNNEEDHSQGLLVDVLIRVSTELQQSALAAQHLEHTISSLTSRVQTPNINDMRDLQAMDLLRQTLAELADFMMALSGEVEATDRIDIAHALANVRLSDLKNRLQCPFDESTGLMMGTDGVELL